MVATVYTVTGIYSVFFSVPNLNSVNTKFAIHMGDCNDYFPTLLSVTPTNSPCLVVGGNSIVSRIASNY